MSQRRWYPIFSVIFNSPLNVTERCWYGGYAAALCNPRCRCIVVCRHNTRGALAPAPHAPFDITSVGTREVLYARA